MKKRPSSCEKSVTSYLTFLSKSALIPILILRRLKAVGAMTSLTGLVP